MPESNFERISDFLKNRTQTLDFKPKIYKKGKVLSVADGVVTIEGLSNCRYLELLQFDGDIYGIALELSTEKVGAVLLDNSDHVGVGCVCLATGRIAEIPVGQSLLGRTVDSIGRPLDGNPLKTDKFSPIERPAPTILDRKKVSSPCPTGITAVDTMIPIGKGQRELIIGDRGTGKTSIAIDAIINQKNNNVKCVYCAIGQKASSVAQIIDTLRENGAMDYCTVVAATASDSPAMQYLAPYAACAIAESYAENGGHSLVVYDDLSKHAVAYRTMSLLLRRPSGREAFPGDVFYLHSRLLERAAALSDQNGGGSITALPIIETVSGNLSAYIPTNVISITDGQIFLESDLFHSGIRPAVNTGLSVSRVGRSAQCNAIKKVSSGLRLTLAQYREMAVFARFGSDLDETTGKILSSGQKLTALLKQPNNNPYSVSRMVCLLNGFYGGVFDSVKVEDIDEAAVSFYEYMLKNCPTEMNSIDKTQDFTDSDKAVLDAVGSKFSFN